MALLDTLKTLNMNTASVGSITSFTDVQTLTGHIQSDLASITDQINNVYYVLLKELTTDALDIGLKGDAVYTKNSATSADSIAFWNVSALRANTVKETVDVLISEIARIDNTVAAALASISSPAASVATTAAQNTLNLEQLRKDTMSDNYTFDADGDANLTYSLAAHVSAIGAFFTGFPGVGITLPAGYPTISLSIALSQLTIDTTLAQTVITDLATDLTTIRTFVGMDAVADSTPDYSAHGTLAGKIADSQPLEQAIALTEIATRLWDDGDVVTLGNSVAPFTITVADSALSAGNGNDITVDSSSISRWFWDHHQIIKDDMSLYFGNDLDGEIYFKPSGAQFIIRTTTVSNVSPLMSVTTGANTGSGNASGLITMGTGTTDADTAVTAGDSGAVTINSGTTDSTNAGGTGGATGNVTLKSGNADSTAGTSGATGTANLKSGDSADSTSGNVTISTGSAAGNAGDFYVITGSSTGGQGGDINMTTGTTGGGAEPASGDVLIKSGAETSATIGTGNWTCGSGDQTVASAATGVDSGTVTLASGDTDSTDAGGTGSASGSLILESGDANSTAGTSGASGGVFLRSGASADANSGDVTLRTGTASSGTRGAIRRDGPVCPGSIISTVTNGSPAIPVDEAVVFINGDAVYAATIADGKNGQKVELVMIANAGPTNAVTISANINGTSLVLDAVGEGATLIFDTTTAQWSCIGTTGTYTP